MADARNVAPFVSVIIPTYNRAESLRRTLDSLALQAYPTDRFEVIVVDDGSTDDTAAIARERFAFPLRYVRQVNQGDAAARNNGALSSMADTLLFVDDDITVEPDFIANITQTLGTHDRAIVLGNLLPGTGQPAPFQSARLSAGSDDQNTEVIHFSECLSGFLAVCRPHYLEIGMMQGLTGRGPDAWCDVDFAYRAHLLGFAFRRSLGAVGYHHDAASASLAVACRRSEHVSQSAVLLFHKYPDLPPHIPMFRDKTPISLRNDPPRLILRKAARAVTAWRPVLWGMERLAGLLERAAPRPALLRPLYRWIISSYIYRGYREGLRKYGPAEAHP